MNNKIEELQIDLPDNIDTAIDMGIKRIKKERKQKIKVSVASLVAVTILGITIPTYAGNLPIFNKITDFFIDNRYEKYDNYATDLNLTKESNGLKVTINKVVYDGLDLAVFYTIEGTGNKADLYTEDIKIDGKRVSFGSSSTWEQFDEENIIIGNITYDVGGRKMLPEEIQDNSFGGYVEIPDEFIFTININTIDKGDEIVKGNWNFDIPVTNASVLGQVEDYTVNESLDSIRNTMKINNVIKTPINTAIQGSYEGEEWTDINFIAFDENGEFLDSKGGSGWSSILNENKYMNYFNIKFKEVDSNCNRIVLIPYEYKSKYENVKSNSYGTIVTSNGKEVIVKDTEGTESGPFKLKEDLNLSGETMLNSILDEKYSVINKVVIENGVTRLYINSEYNVFGVPYVIKDKDTGEEFTLVDDFETMNLKTTKYLYESNELIVEYNGELQDKNYEVYYYDHTNEMKFYSNDIIKFNIK